MAGKQETAIDLGRKAEEHHIHLPQEVRATMFYTHVSPLHCYLCTEDPPCANFRSQLIFNNVLGVSELSTAGVAASGRCRGRGSQIQLNNGTC